MKKSILTLTASAFILATTMGTAQAQSTDNDDTMQRGQGMMQQGQSGDHMKQGREGKKKYGKHRDRHHEMMRRHHGGYGMGGGMGGGMGHGMMMQVVFAMMDADGNDSLSLQEVQDAHARIFAHMDANDDGEVTKAEIKAFFKGGKDRRAGRRDGSEMSDDMDEADDLNLSDDVGDDDDGDDN